MSKERLKTEHGGPKQGKGFCGRRSVAKQVSKKERRSRDKSAESEAQEEHLSAEVNPRCD